MTEISSEDVEATWREVGGLSDARARKMMDRLGREQPDLLAFAFGATSELSQPVHAFAIYVFLVVWRIFERATPKGLPRIDMATIERRFEENDEQLAKLEASDPRFLERAAKVQASRQPAVFEYMVTAVMEAPLDPDDPLEVTPEETGELYRVLKTAIDLLDDARTRVGAG